MGVSKGKSAQKPRFCAREARKRWFRRVKAHKNLDFVLEKPENEGFEGQKSTKMPILCSEWPKMKVSKGKSAQKCRFCAREEGKVASGSVTVAGNAKPWPGMQNRGAKKQEGGLILATLWVGCASVANVESAANDALRVLSRCVASDALRTMRCEQCAASNALRQRRRVSCTPPGPLLQSW